jgi:PAS domain-containing protein
VTAEVAIGRSSSRGDSKSAAEAPSRWIVADCERRVMLLKNNDAAALAQAIVDTIREPLLVLDKDLRVLAASRSFYLTFKVAQEETEDRLLYELGDGQWDVCGLRVLLESIVPEQGVMDNFEVEHLFPKIGRRTMLLNARKVFYEGNSHTTMLLGIETSPQGVRWSAKGRTCFASRKHC